MCRSLLTPHSAQDSWTFPGDLGAPSSGSPGAHIDNGQMHGPSTGAAASGLAQVGSQVAAYWWGVSPGRTTSRVTDCRSFLSKGVRSRDPGGFTT